MKYLNIMDVPQIVESFKKEHNVYKVPSLKEDNLNITYLHDDNESKSMSRPPYPFAESEIYESEVISSKTFYNNECNKKSAYEICVRYDKTKYEYKVGDTIGIITKNKTEDVDFLLERLDLKEKANQCYLLEAKNEVKKSPIPNYVPVKSSLCYLLSKCLELRSVVKKLFIAALASYTADALEKECLQILSSKEGSVLYNKYVLEKFTSVLDILEMFPSCKPPITVLIQNLPRLLPRPYSIVNSSKSNPGKLKICFSVYNNKKGLTTGWLEKLAVKRSVKDDISENFRNLNISDEKVEFYFRKNMGFCLPENLDKPLILIGIGTGVGPYIGFLEEISEKHNEKELWLICGFKSPKHMIYEDEIQSFVDKKVINKLICCYSASTDHPKTYVQDAITKNSKEIIEKLENDGILYLCGDLNSLVREMETVLANSYKNVLNKSAEESLDFIKRLKSNKQFVVDAWS